MKKSVKIIIAIIIVLAILSGIVYVVSSIQASANASTLSETEISEFNAKFDSFVGTQNGASIKGLVFAVDNNNINHDGEGERELTIEFNGQTYGTDEIINLIELIDDDSDYTVNLLYNGNQLLTSIQITGQENVVEDTVENVVE